MIAISLGSNKHMGMTHLEVYKLGGVGGGGPVVAATCDMPVAGSPKHVARRV